MSATPFGGKFVANDRFAHEPQSVAGRFRLPLVLEKWIQTSSHELYSNAESEFVHHVQHFPVLVPTPPNPQLHQPARWNKLLFLEKGSLS